MNRDELAKRAKKTVPVRMQVWLTVEVPSEWDDDMVEFWLNESSHCSNNEIKRLAEECDTKPKRCFCWRTEFNVEHDAKRTAYLEEQDDDET